jgi:hypothetical protein
MDMMREAIEKRASETLAAEDGGPFLKGKIARLGLSIKTMRTSFMSIGVASNIRTCAEKSSVWRQSIARPQS